jgi:hypothetical protein
LGICGSSEKAKLLSRQQARNREEELMVNIFRIGIPDYSEQAFHEGLANALIHRDYSRLGAVHVQWHDEAHGIVTNVVDGDTFDVTIDILLNMLYICLAKMHYLSQGKIYIITPLHQFTTSLKYKMVITRAELGGDS